MGLNAMYERFGLFDGLDDADKGLLSSLFEKKSYGMNDVIYNEGEKGGTLYFLMKGKVRICRLTQDGDVLPYASVNEGESFGLMSFIDGTDHTAMTVADKDSEVFKIEKADFEKLFTANPALTAKLYRNIGVQLCEIIRDMNKQYMDLTSYMFKRG
ncbi:MAG: cyclic nucleotide-binding domain-containing protein [Candidatus Magnetominusculus sp. LBB02]|nr:cyclic nucleotide-binding domain-containing protein [Candidatus Magnetominusculus sp. LBB02]